jgi:hypothetical protein
VSEGFDGKGVDFFFHPKHGSWEGQDAHIMLQRLYQAAFSFLRRPTSNDMGLHNRRVGVLLCLNKLVNKEPVTCISASPDTYEYFMCFARTSIFLLSSLPSS